MIPNMVKFWIVLVVLVPSILCSIFTLYHLLIDRTNRLALNNHIIVLLLGFGLISELTIYPWMIYYYQVKNSWDRPFILCQFWAFIDWGFCSIQYILFAWATIERHILIFHDKWVSTRMKRLHSHYAPILFLFVYSILYHSMVLFFPPCQNTPNPYSMWCVTLCLMNNELFLSYDTIAHHILTVLIIIVSSLFLLIRVICQKRRLQQSFQWRKHRKMIVQLLSISFLYFVFAFPHTIWYIALLAQVPMSIMIPLLDYASFLTYFPTLLLPFICASLLPQLRSKLKKICHRSQHLPIIIPMIQSARFRRTNET